MKGNKMLFVFLGWQKSRVNHTDVLNFAIRTGTVKQGYKLYKNHAALSISTLVVGLRAGFEYRYVEMLRLSITTQALQFKPLLYVRLFTTVDYFINVLW